MEKLKLIINGEMEYILEDDLVTLGRASDNLIAFPEDSNVSRYHAEIEKRDDGYWVVELGSFNGSTINGAKFETEKPLLDGDLILLGGSSEIKVSLLQNEEESEEEEKKKEEAPESQQTEEAAPPEEKAASKMPAMLIFASLFVGLAIVFVGAAAIYYFTRPAETASDCNAKVSIVKPENADIIKEPTQIELSLENAECVSKASIEVEGKERASAMPPNFSATLNPDDFPEFSDGIPRILRVVLKDQEGKQITKSEEIVFSVETIVTETPEETPEDPNLPPKPNQTPVVAHQTEQISTSDSVAMSEKIIKQFPGNFTYNARNPSFLREVNRMTAEYISPGYYERAKKYRDVINVQYIQERSLDPSLAYILAMSRSKFEPANDPNGIGLWKMTNELIKSGNYDGLCKEPLENASQRCAAVSSAAYLEELAVSVFDGDLIYTVAAFGMTPQQAELWKTSLPADPNARADFWNVIKSRHQREQVARFFAAAVVAENPRKFGLLNDRPLSDLYKFYKR